jgi:hypothetical protein
MANENLIRKPTLSVAPRKVADYFKARANAIQDAMAKLTSGKQSGLTKGDMLKMGFAAEVGDVAPISTDAIGVPVQFLQYFMPGVVRLLTEVRMAEKLMGITQAGTWEMEQIVFMFSELKARITEYVDFVDTPRSSYNLNFSTRDIVRFISGVEQNKLQADRAQHYPNGFNDIEEKRASLQRAFAIIRNQIALYGWANKRVYGFLNDPLLPAYVPVAASGTGSSTLWINKTFDLKLADVRESLNALSLSAGGNFEPENGDKWIWAVPLSLRGELTATYNALGSKTLLALLKEEYSGLLVVYVPQLVNAVGGDDGWYMYLDEHVPQDTSTDDGLTWANCQQLEMAMIGSVPTEHGGFKESYTSALSGAVCKRPNFVVRRSAMST